MGNRTGVRFKTAIILTAALLLAVGSLWAHHSPSAEFDMSKRITVSGVLTKVDWINPHITLAMEVKNESGKVETWSFESNPPAWFRRVGVTRNDLAKAIGQTVTAEGGCRFRSRCVHAIAACAEQVPALQNVGQGHLAACHLSEPVASSSFNGNETVNRAAATETIER